MQLIIEGDAELHKRLFDLTKVMQRTFWIGVQEDFEKHLIKNIVPHSKTGKLERNAYVDIIKNGVEGGIRDNGMLVSWRGARINYGVFVHEGTKAHPITPTKKKALSFDWKGKTRAFGRVEHPGYKGDPFLENAAKTTFGNLERIFDKELKKQGVI